MIPPIFARKKGAGRSLRLEKTPSAEYAYSVTKGAKLPFPFNLTIIFNMKLNSFLS